MDGSLSGGRSTSSNTSVYAPGTSIEERSYTSQAFFNGNVGLGYGFELFAGLPYVLRNRTDVHYSYGEERESSSFNGEKGFNDATFGLKYRVFKSADGSNEVLLRFSLLRHSGFSGFVDSEVSYLHTFTPAIKTVLSASFMRRQGGPNNTGYGAYLIWQASRQIAVVPFIRGNRYDEYMGAPSFSSAGGGVELRYTPIKSWNITPGLSGTHINAPNGYSGSWNGISGSLTVQKEF
ncbi:hypothetical protein LT85_2194 [Collimonas arenae]|uniref:Uncharacterized protein n=1 Tax=Collimonas arenae TaxID=279058 RepID=A0A0A1FEU2_9BURK|nr:hypothetical protein LT85_2194 [Collimonas arenae]